VGCIFATIDGVKAAVETDKLYEAQTEIRHLKNTIQALRDELEAMRMGKDEAVQAAIAAGANEARQLQATIAALRAEMEQKIFQHADDLERQKHVASDELRLLRETIAALREELEVTGPGGRRGEE
jgi:chromosome segregation ATPase